MEEIKTKIQNWWNSSPCCSKATSSMPGTKEFYEQVDLYKDTHEPFTNCIADYPAWKGKNILEIGCGLGKDFSRFAAAGAKATAVDMSIRSLELTAKRFKIFNLNGNFCLADAENLPFKNSTFDLIFSWGVIHHTPNAQKTIDEIYRCLNKKNSTALIMLYNKCSLHYMRFLLYYSRRFKLLRKIKRLFSPWKWLERFKVIPAESKHSSTEQCLATFTDDLGNPISRVYSMREAKCMFSKFKSINIRAYEPNPSSFIKIFKFLKISERYLGWFLVIKAKK